MTWRPDLRCSLMALLVVSGGALIGCDSGGGESVETATSFELFRANTPYDAALGAYILDGDVKMSEPLLRSYFERRMCPQPASRALGDGVELSRQSLVSLATFSGGISQWSSSQAMNLTYCVSSAFGANQSTVISAMAASNLRWASSGMVNFVHLADHDSNCTSGNNSVLFNVIPHEFAASESTVADAFFPNDARQNRQLRVSMVALGSGRIVDVLTHETGHILGFAHEATRVGPGAGRGQWEGPNWAAITDNDPQSIMLSGIGTFTTADRTGAACVYGAAPGFSPNCTFRGVVYDSHVQNIGWLPFVRNNDITGTIGQFLRMEAARFLISGIGNAGICYQAHVQSIGWQPEVCNLQTAGTVGQGLRMEAIRIRLTNAPPGCSVVYQAHVQNIGWMSPVQDNATAGTEGQSLRLEALKVGLTSACFI